MSTYKMEISPDGTELVVRIPIALYKSQEVSFINQNMTSKLSKRQLEVFDLFLLNYKEIADRLFISRRTVKWHVRCICQQLQMSRKAIIFNYHIHRQLQSMDLELQKVVNIRRPRLERMSA